MEILNHARGYRFMLGVLRNQQQDPFCGKCSAWNNSLNNVRESLAEFEKVHGAEIRALPEAARMLAEAREGLAALNGPAEPIGQKKAGNCKLLQGVCFVKTAKALLEQI